MMKMKTDNGFSVAECQFLQFGGVRAGKAADHDVQVALVVACHSLRFGQTVQRKRERKKNLFSPFLLVLFFSRMLFEFKRQKKQHVFCTYVLGYFDSDAGDIVFSLFGEDRLEEMKKSVATPLCQHVYRLK
jgi:hypothetical protein